MKVPNLKQCWNMNCLIEFAEGGSWLDYQLIERDTNSEKGKIWNTCLILHFFVFNLTKDSTVTLSNSHMNLLLHGFETWLGSWAGTVHINQLPLNICMLVSGDTVWIAVSNVFYRCSYFPTYLLSLCCLHLCLTVSEFHNCWIEGSVSSFSRGCYEPLLIGGQVHVWLFQSISSVF